MAWKALKEVMTRYGVGAAASGSPREIIRLAGQYLFLGNPRAWDAMLDRRNANVHVYDEEAADDLVVLIGERYLPCFAQLLDHLDMRMQQLAADEN